MNSDGPPGCHQVSARDQVIAGEGGTRFLIGGTPDELPRPGRQDVGRRAANDGSARRIYQALHSIPSAMNGSAPVFRDAAILARVSMLHLKNRPIDASSTNDDRT